MMREEKRTMKTCGVLAASGSEELLQAVLLSLRDVQDTMSAAGPKLRIFTAQTMTQVKQKAVPGAAAEAPRIIVFGMTAKDSACLDDLLLLSGRDPGLQILLLVRKEVFSQTAWRCRKHHIYVFALPFRRQILTEILRMMADMQGVTRTKEEELLRLRRKVSELGLTTKAKCLLIQYRQMSEEEAHHYLERRAMDDCVSKKEIAQEIIRTFEG